MPASNDDLERRVRLLEGAVSELQDRLQALISALVFQGIAVE